MKKHASKITMGMLALILLASGCVKKTDTPVTTTPATTYTSLSDFYTSNAVKSEFFKLDAAKGGSFTSAKGSKVTIPANCFLDNSSNPLTGTIQVEFKDIYKKSDMLLSQMPVMLGNGAPLKSAGEFFILVTKDSGAVALAPNKAIAVEQPANGAAVDSIGMKPFIFGNGVAGKGWSSNSADSLRYYPSSYVFSLYNFSSPAGAGTWCNSDNATYFSSYPQTSLTIVPDFVDTTYGLDVYLVFKGINSMVHVYRDNSASNFPYLYAPTGLSCTVVAVGYKDHNLYSSFTDVTISANQTVHIPSVSQTTGADFKSKLTGLD